MVSPLAGMLSMMSRHWSMNLFFFCIDLGSKYSLYNQRDSNLHALTYNLSFMAPER